MTGYGDARFHSDSIDLAIELRALNNRYLKVSVRASEPYNLLESEFEKVIRRTVRRGTIQVHVRCERTYSAGEFRINTTAVRSYLSQLRGLADEMGLSQRAEGLLGGILALPGVVPEPGDMAHVWQEEWPLVERVLQE